MRPGRPGRRARFARRWMGPLRGHDAQRRAARGPCPLPGVSRPTWRPFTHGRPTTMRRRHASSPTIPRSATKSSVSTPSRPSRSGWRRWWRIWASRSSAHFAVPLRYEDLLDAEPLDRRATVVWPGIRGHCHRGLHCTDGL